jgi:hypothetical protein
MEGFPPPPDRAIVAADGSAWAFPRTRWAFSHMRELYPTANVSRGEAPVALLPRAERHDLDAVVFTTADGRRMTWGESLAANYTDGVIVLHRGVTVQERYFGALQPELAHTAMSVTESFVGTLAAMLADRRVLDPQAAVTHYLPELAATAYAGATLRQVMDMTIGVRYSETEADPQADARRYARAGGMLPRPADFDGPRRCPWPIVKRATAAALDARSICWVRLGAEHDALCGRQRRHRKRRRRPEHDAARRRALAGEPDGWFNGQQIVPERVVAGIRRGADKAVRARGYTTLRAGRTATRGGSRTTRKAPTPRAASTAVIWIDPKAEMVIARYASHPGRNSPHLDDLAAGLRSARQAPAAQRLSAGAQDRGTLRRLERRRAALDTCSACAVRRASVIGDTAPRRIGALRRSATGRSPHLAIAGPRGPPQE